MPAYVKKSIKKVTKKVVNPTIQSIETDPALVNEIAAADSQVDYLNIDSLDANMAVGVFRYQGARPDLLRLIDATAYTTASAVGITEIAWPDSASGGNPPGAARKIRLDLNISAGSGSITLEMDTVYRTEGG